VSLLLEILAPVVQSVLYVWILLDRLVQLRDFPQELVSQLSVKGSEHLQLVIAELNKLISPTVS
jgi:hypothetical protein